MIPFQNPEVKKVFESYPKAFRDKLLHLRDLIFRIAEKTEGVGPLEETLRWGEPSYLTTKTQSGSILRLDWKKSMPGQYGLYFHCGTTLVFEFKEIFGALFKYKGNRAILFDLKDLVPEKELSECIAKTLTYHLTKRKI